MICIKAVIKGEDDIPPFTRLFEYLDRSDELIFFEAVRMIKQRLSKNLKININECLMVYYGYIIERLRANESVKSIEDDASKVLSLDQVMIGVPESLKKITLEVKTDVDDNSTRKETININSPLPTCKYILSAW
jgi:urease gamma subunit